MTNLLFSVKGQYALLAVLDLTMAPAHQPVKIADISRRQRIPQKFLELILSGLKQGGFVESRRGADGGYLLARPADSISVGEVLEYVEGDRSARRSAKSRPDSPFVDLWREVDQAVTAILNRASFAEIARSWGDKQSTYIPNWEI